LLLFTHAYPVPVWSAVALLKSSAVVICAPSAQRHGREQAQYHAQAQQQAHQSLFHVFSSNFLFLQIIFKIQYEIRQRQRRRWFCRSLPPVIEYFFSQCFILDYIRRQNSLSSSQRMKTPVSFCLFGKNFVGYSG
jgi:hypothetical protein